MSNANLHRLALFILWVILILSPFTRVALAESESGSALASKNFWELNNALPNYHLAAQYEWEEIPVGLLLKMGTKSHYVAVLKEHLRRLGDLSEYEDTNTSRFDSHLARAVKNFQDRHGLKADGVVGKDTLLQLNIPPEFRARQIAVNMQRWADLFGKLGSRFIIVNIPDFHMYLIENDRTILMLRAIVGKPDLQTPELSSKITRIILNPFWNIPNKIAVNDIVPKMLQDPSYLSRMHIRAFRVADNDATQVNPYRINWSAAAENRLNYTLRQDPGPDNALGLVKFEFQNNHDVYMHDTSAKNLFEQEIRSFSHGCIRLENPFALVEYLMKDNPRWNNDRIQRILDSGVTTYVNVPEPIPIFITYLTSWVDQEGRVNFRNDLYQLDGEDADNNNTVAYGN